MALRELPRRVGPTLANDARLIARPLGTTQYRNASSQTRTTPEVFEDLERSSLASPGPSEDIVKSFDPVGRSRQRQGKLPPSRYQFRPPKYYRGPLHPHQPPPQSSPESRLFVPGPFSLPRLEQHYHNTIAPDLLTLAYSHLPPGFVPPPKAPRLRTWDDSSPYHKNRPARGPRGGDVLRLLKRPTNFHNITKLEKVTIHTMVKGAMEDSAHLHVAGMVVQAITSIRATSCKAKESVAGFGLRGGKYTSVKAEIVGESMYHFLSRLVDVVLPRIKDWKGAKGSSGDSSGNISFGLTPEAVGLFPEVEVNYDMSVAPRSRIKQTC
ncbi:hypothetical protein FGG08_005818 [Glutinoglossum americanum]|uniref:Ribosomal protein L5 n=1 Tax=Glutinoglossum americanum TaxID=1670608 RepID=A0A9P8KY49_9PEZI|nr:hypothetical protein FGG08_005818 [Glutinoglossum americanum]